MADNEAPITDEDEGAEENGELPEPVMAGDRQMSLNLGTVLPRTAKKTPAEATVKLSAQQVPIDGLLAADTEYDFLVRGKVQRYIVQPDRNADGDTEAAAVHMPVRTLRVARADTEQAIVDLWVSLLERDRAAAERVQDALSDARKAHIAAVA